MQDLEFIKIKINEILSFYESEYFSPLNVLEKDKSVIFKFEMCLTSNKNELSEFVAYELYLIKRLKKLMLKKGLKIELVFDFKLFLTQFYKFEVLIEK